MNIVLAVFDYNNKEYSSLVLNQPYILYGTPFLVYYYIIIFIVIIVIVTCYKYVGCWNVYLLSLNLLILDL